MVLNFLQNYVIKYEIQLLQSDKCFRFFLFMLIRFGMGLYYHIKKKIKIVEAKNCISKLYVVSLCNTNTMYISKILFL